MLSRRTQATTGNAGSGRRFFLGGTPQVDFNVETTTTAGAVSQPVSPDDPASPAAAPPKSIGAVLSRGLSERLPIDDVRSILHRVTRTLSTLKRIQVRNLGPRPAILHI
ncbi:hypothetical protein LSAT2_026161 [Lamellibrachia satsuma]|nr:hypothetical protein LSAT2_026161 [Lamellibrachia satsuma]